MDCVLSGWYHAESNDKTALIACENKSDDPCGHWKNSLLISTTNDVYEGIVVTLKKWLSSGNHDGSHRVKRIRC